MAVFVTLFEHLLPLLIVRRDPERVLMLLLPSFDLDRSIAAARSRARWSASSRPCGGSVRPPRPLPETRRRTMPVGKRHTPSWRLASTKD